MTATCQFLVRLMSGVKSLTMNASDGSAVGASSLAERRVSDTPMCLRLGAAQLKFQKLLKVPMSPVPAQLEAPDVHISATELEVADVVGRLMHFWGFKRPMGRVWSVLYLSERPLTAAELGESLKMSAGAVSMALSELEKWGAIHRTWIPGDRRDHFSAEADIWKLVQRVMRERELTLVRDFTASLIAADVDLSRRQADSASERPEVDGGVDQALNYKRQRLARLRYLSETGERLLGALVDGSAINPSALMKPKV